MNDRVPICGGFICINADPTIIEYVGGANPFKFHRERYREVTFRGSNAGMRIMRKFLWSPASWFGVTGSINKAFTPYAVIGEQFDLLHENPWYWPIMEEMKEIDKTANVTGRYDIANNCDFVSDAWAKWVPWRNNIQGITTLYQVKAHPYFKKLFLSTMEHMGKDQYYGANECNAQGFVTIFDEILIPMIRDGIIDPELFNFGAVMDEAEYLGNNKYPEKIPEGVLGTLKRHADVLGEKTKLLIYRDVHSLGAPPYSKGKPLPYDDRKYGPMWHQLRLFWGHVHQIRSWASTDGKTPAKGHAFASKCDTQGDEPRISAETWYNIAVDLMNEYPSEKGGMKRCLALEHCPQLHVRPENMDCIENTLRKISEAVYKVKGDWPENYKQHPYVPEPVYVTVKVCQTSALLPNAYCPTVIEKKYVKGKEPTKVCTVHIKPADPEPEPQPDPGPPTPDPTPIPAPPHSWIKDNWGWIALGVLALVALAFIL